MVAPENKLRHNSGTGPQLMGAILPPDPDVRHESDVALCIFEPRGPGERFLYPKKGFKKLVGT